MDSAVRPRPKEQSVAIVYISCFRCLWVYGPTCCYGKLSGTYCNYAGQSSRGMFVWAYYESMLFRQAFTTSEETSNAYISQLSSLVTQYMHLCNGMSIQATLML